MGATLQLIEMLGETVRRGQGDSKIYDWMRAISTIADNISGGTQAQVRYVNTAGSDTTGDGSFDNPYLTVQAAITSITDATASKPYAVHVAPGIFSSNFVLQPWIFIIGAGRNATVLVNAAANWVGAGFSTGGDAGIVECTIRTNSVTVDFNAVASATGRFFLYDYILDATGVAVTGSASTNLFASQNGQQLSSTVLNFSVTNCPCICGAIELFNTNLNITNTAAFLMGARIGSITGNRAITLTCADLTNLLSVSCSYWSTISTYIVVVGSGVTILGRSLVFHQTLPDADTTINFTTPLVAGALVAANEGENLWRMTPTANRTVTMGEANPGTRIRLVNASNFIITLAGIVVGSAQQTYIPPGGVFEAYREAGSWCLVSINVPQIGTGVLVNGVSALVPADISANSVVRPVVTNLNGSAGIGVLVALDADKTNGTRAGGGGFIIRSLTLAGVAVATDQSSFRWTVVRGN